MEPCSWELPINLEAPLESSYPFGMEIFWFNAFSEIWKKKSIFSLYPSEKFVYSFV